jgi:hypothetical protein
VVLLLLSGLGALVLARHGSPRESGPVREARSAELPGPGVQPPSATRGVVLDAGLCADAGYLCSGLADRDEPRILRWNDDTPSIRVRLPLPTGVDPARGRELQAAAAAGLLTWQDKPFRIELERGPGTGAADFEIRWAERLEGRQLGRADTRWFREPDGVMGMQVRDFVLVHRDPFDPGRALSLRQVQLAAAHEMGHALGLPHSDSDRDVMFPTNTARSLTARDYATMAALYRSRNGALIARGVAPGIAASGAGR